MGHAPNGVGIDTIFRIENASMFSSGFQAIETFIHATLQDSTYSHNGLFWNEVRIRR